MHSPDFQSDFCPAALAPPDGRLKALYALCPHTAMPWDAAIAGELHGRRDAAVFPPPSHRPLPAQAVLIKSGLRTNVFAAEFSRPAITMPKALDEQPLVTISRRAP